MTSRAVRIGTRSSPLARWQANWVAHALRQHGNQVELVFITTQGDVRTGPLGQIGGQGLFTKEIQRALLSGEVDIAVHSLKDLPTAPVEGLKIGAVPEREATGDAFLSRNFASLAELPAGATIGTGSLRRQAQILNFRPDLKVADIRGNVDTRLSKLAAGDYHAIILAEAGLRRLELAEHIREVLPQSIMLPAVGQGALGIEIREDDITTQQVVAVLNHAATFAAVTAERAMLAELRGGCLAPVGAFARLEAAQLVLSGVVLNVNGSQKLSVEQSTTLELAADLGRAVAQQLRAQGADELIATSRSTS
jgi:hydroxymethylbilane synthase